MLTDIRLKQKVLEPDAEMIREASLSCAGSAFSGLLAAHMKKKNCSLSELSRRLGLSRQALGKWRSGEARPQDKETVKETGLALELAEEELNGLLLSLGYTRLYPKSPLDSACIFILDKKNAQGNLPAEYRELLRQYRIRDIGLMEGRKTIPTIMLNKSLEKVMTGKELDEWLNRNLAYFSALKDTLLPKFELQLFIKLFLGGETIHKQYTEHSIPKAIRDWLYPLTSGSELTQKELRDKLIAFGLFKNMAVEEIDYMLELAALRRFTESENSCEAAMLAAVRLAHDRFPPYADDCLGVAVYPELDRILNHFSGKDNAALTDAEKRQLAFYERFKERIIGRIDTCWEAAEKYRMIPHDEAEQLFEKYYTDRDLDYTRSLAVYIRDISDTLIEKGYIRAKDAASLRNLLQLEEERP